VTVVGLIGVEKSYGSWPVLRGANLEVPERGRIGLVGPNGAGKSTLLKILADMEDAGAGEVVRRKGLVISYLEQNPDGDGRTPEQTVLAARPHVAELDAELRAVEAELARPDALALLQAAPTPEVGRTLSRAKIVSLLRRGGRQRNLESVAAEIQAQLRAPQLAAPALVSAAYGTSAAATVRVLGELNAQIASLEAELTQSFESHPDAELYRVREP